MLRVIVQASAAGAKAYFAGGGEYYAEGREYAGEWGGRAAGRLGLAGGMERAAFDALCENRHPHTGERLTPRTKASRRVGFDLNFHVPKSVSVVFALTADRPLLDAFRSAVRETLDELETETRTRVRAGGADDTRPTGNLVYAVFVHATARPVGGVPDPHLHAHAFAFNLTFDAAEGRWKAVDLGEVYRNAPYYEAVFHARFAGKLVDLGFGVDRRGAGWELAGVPDRVTKEFSRRTRQIDTLAERLGVTDPEVKARLGALTRERKQFGFTLHDLRRLWATRLTPDERTAVARVAAREVPVAARTPDAARDAMRFAVEHGFERSSVLPVKRLLAVALRQGVGQVLPEAAERELPGHGLVVRVYNGERLATTREVLAEERRVVAFARGGRGACRPLTLGDHPPPDWLSPDQRAAVRHVLTSRDRVTVVRGVAGSGKTTLIKECVAAIQGEGKAVAVLAPSAAASRGVLRGEGFTTADTVARFLADETFRASARGGVVWVDEAGLLGLRTLDAVFRLAATLDARVVLSGDERQHKAVERGEPLTLLRQHAGLEPAAVREIRRQRGRYREAVAHLSEGRTVEGFDVLDLALGWVRELPEADQATAIAADYVAARAAGKTVLVVSPTHAEGGRITRSIRAALRSARTIGPDGVVLTRLAARDLTLAERRDPCSYAVGDVIEFHSRAKGFRRGARYTVSAAGRETVAATDEAGRETVLPLGLAGRFGVFAPGPISFAVGDLVRVTQTGRTADGERVDNGTVARVAALTPDGGLRLEGGATLPPGFAHLTHGYVVTSHASQGRTVDRVLIAQSSESFRASGREQFYVSASRGRESVTVYTDDKGGLRRAIVRTDPVRSGTELLGPGLPPGHAWRAWVASRLRSSRPLTGRSPTPAGARPAAVAERPTRVP